MAFATSLQCTFQTQGKSVADHTKAGEPAVAEEVPYWMITLTNAQVSELTTNTVPAATVSGAAGIASTASTDTHEITKIQFTFQKIEINAVQDKKSASDDWTL